MSTRTNPGLRRAEEALVALMAGAAQGQSDAEISVSTGMSPVQVRQLRRRPDVKAAIALIADGDFRAAFGAFEMALGVTVWRLSVVLAGREEPVVTQTLDLVLAAMLDLVATAFDQFDAAAGGEGAVR